MRYVLELWRSEDDRVEGQLGREGSTEMTPFSGWIELFSLLEPPPLEHGPKGEEPWQNTTSKAGWTGATS